MELCCIALGQFLCFTKVKKHLDGIAHWGKSEHISLCNWIGLHTYHSLQFSVPFPFLTWLLKRIAFPALLKPSSKLWPKPLLLITLQLPHQPHPASGLYWCFDVRRATDFALEFVLCLQIPSGNPKSGKEKMPRGCWLLAPCYLSPHLGHYQISLMIDLIMTKRKIKELPNKSYRIKVCSSFPWLHWFIGITTKFPRAGASIQVIDHNYQRFSEA